MATENPPSSQDIQSLEGIQDSDLDYLIDDMEGIENAELLKWVTQLDYKDYFHHWFMIGSSGFTDSNNLACAIIKSNLSHFTIVTSSLSMPKGSRQLISRRLILSLSIGKTTCKCRIWRCEILLLIACTTIEVDLQMRMRMSSPRMSLFD